MQRLLDFFGSVRLTLGVLLLLSAAAVGGTLWPVEQTFGDGLPVQRFDLYYQGWWFRALLGLLAVNLLVCTWRTLRRAAGERQKLLALVTKGLAPGATGYRLPAAAAAEMAERLEARGFRVAGAGDGLLGQRRGACRWAVPVLHLAVVAIMAGSFASILGFVGTINLYVTHQTDQVFDWETEASRPLGFALRLDHFEVIYYPIELQIAVVDPQSHETLNTVTSREGGSADLGNGLTARVLHFDPDEEHLTLFLERRGYPIGEYHALGGARDYPNNPNPGVIIKPAAFRDPMVRQLHSEVTVLEEGREVRRGVIEVNTPLVHRGVTIYQTAYSRDPNGFWYCGFQFSRDPGEPLVWCGSVILALALLTVFSLRPQAVAVVPHAGGWQLISLGGFRGEAGRQRLEELAAKLGEERQLMRGNSEESAGRGEGDA